jgi:hypothetical protein
MAALAVVSQLPLLACRPAQALPGAHAQPQPRLPAAPLRSACALVHRAATSPL